MTFAYSDECGPVVGLGWCCLCGQRTSVVGVFLPTTDDMKAAVRRVRREPRRRRRVLSDSNLALPYGLCLVHAADPRVIGQVEAAIRAAAEGCERLK